MVAALVVAPFFIYPLFLMKALCFALFACAFNLLIGYVGLLVVRPRALFRLGELSGGPFRQGLGLPAGARDPHRHADRRGARRRRRLARDPPPGHLLRDDHARARADDVLLRAAGEVHRRRGRHPGGAARKAVRADRPQQPVQHVHHRAGDLPRRLPVHLSRHQLAVRRGAQGDPRERAARDLARLQDRPLQAGRLRALGDARGPCRRAPRRSCCRSPRSPTWTGRCRARWC